MRYILLKGRVSGFLFTLLVGLLFSTGHTLAQATWNNSSPISTIKRQEAFWQAVFTQYPSSTHLIHDLKEPWVLIDVIDFTKIKKYKSEKERKSVVRRYLKRYKKALERVKQFGKEAHQFGLMEERISQVYKHRINHPLQEVKIRSQQGLADKFLQAAIIAKRLLPFMERVFQKERVPTEITRLAFIESMFNHLAHSKQGAKGIWQIMPATAKKYLKMNHLIDERKSPYKATIAAAKILRENYELLGTWPLAITAYNHGAKGIQEAISSLGTKNLNTIINQYRSPSFKFASRNFYSELLAAQKSYRIILEKNPNLISTGEDIESFYLKTKLSTFDLTEKLKIPSSIIKQYNPDIHPNSFNKYLLGKLPENYQIYLPSKIAPNFKKTFNRLKEKGDLL